jgi:hypothetical protein
MDRERMWEVVRELPEYRDGRLTAAQAERMIADFEARKDELLREFIEAEIRRALIRMESRGELPGGQFEDFGVCPICKGHDGYLNVGRDHWFKCDEHKVRWHVGSNLFSSWHDESEEDWEENARILSEYEEVGP